MMEKAVHYSLVCVFVITVLVQGVVSVSSFYRIIVIVSGVILARGFISRKVPQRMAKVMLFAIDYLIVFTVVMFLQTDQVIYYSLFLFPVIRQSLQYGKRGSLYAVAATAACFLFLWQQRQLPLSQLFLLLNTIAAASWFIGATADKRKSYQELSNRDWLTGVYNRRYFQDSLRENLQLAKQRKETAVLMMLDLDRFKEINDVYGHVAGDRILQQFAALIAEQVRSADIVNRYGGEEFALIFPRMTLQQAVRVAERIREKVESHEFVVDDGRKIHITVSIGVAAFTGQGTETDLIRAADKALYRAKKERNRVVVEG